MYETVNSVFATNSGLVGTLNPLAAAHEKFKAGQAAINLNRQVQEVKNTGLTRDKAGLRENVVRMIILFSAGLKAYAAIVNDLDLRTKASYSVTKLNTVADSVLYDIGILINGLAISRKDEMTKYFVGEAELTEMDRLLTEFKLAIPKRRLATSVSKVSTGNISDIFVAQDKLLKEQIDVLMLLFRSTQPDFYNAYKNARSIVDYTGRGKDAVAENPAVAN